MGRVERMAFYAAVASLMLGLTFVFGFYSALTRNAVFDMIVFGKNLMVITLESLPTSLGIRPSHFLQPARHQGAGVTVNNDAIDKDEVVFLSGFFEDSNELRLIRRNGDIIARWPVRFSEIFPDTSHIEDRPAPATDWNIEIHGALALADGSVVFNFEYGGLVKLDRCGDVTWTLARQTHHSVELAEGGGFWVPGRRVVKGSDSPFLPFQMPEGNTPLREDTLLKVAEDGTVLSETSVPKIFYDNGLEAVLTATGHDFTRAMEWDSEIVHLNKIDELTSDIADDFSIFTKGDLALSIREMNLVMVIDPKTTKVKWWKIGPWLRQHDPEFRSGGTIVLFNNNMYKIPIKSHDRASNIIEIDPMTGSHEIIFDGADNDMRSLIRGKVELTSIGGLLMTDFQGGRVIETDIKGNIIWEYINRYSLDEIAEITEARTYPSSYFNVDDWSCSQS